MTQQYLSPYINFGGRAREAMEFYHALLGGTLDLQASDEPGATLSSAISYCLCR